MAKGFVQGFYQVRNPEKYTGTKPPFARSSWEIGYMEYFDNNPEVLEWASEEVTIPYLKPTDGKIHRYTPDFIVLYRNPDGGTHVELIEVKPAAQARASRSKNAQRRLAETATYAINSAKWLAAGQWCRERGIIFRILTEKGDVTAEWTKQIIAAQR